MKLLCSLPNQLCHYYCASRYIFVFLTRVFAFVIFYNNYLLYFYVSHGYFCNFKNIPGPPVTKMEAQTTAKVQRRGAGLGQVFEEPEVKLSPTPVVHWPTLQLPASTAAQTPKMASRDPRTSPQQGQVSYGYPLQGCRSTVVGKYQIKKLLFLTFSRSASPWCLVGLVYVMVWTCFLKEKTLLLLFRHLFGRRKRLIFCGSTTSCPIMMEAQGPLFKPVATFRDILSLLQASLNVTVMAGILYSSHMLFLRGHALHTSTPSTL